jgi:D-alanyl-D-alanine carboxypeptidase
MFSEVLVMSLRFLSAFLRTFSVMGLFCAGIAFAPLASAEKYASIVVDADTREVLHARYADETRYPASLTKVMTLYMVFDALDSGELALDEKLKVSKFAAKQAPSNLKLKAGSSITVSDAISALVNKSANDVAVVVAERLGGSEARFATLMTEKAKTLGLENTTFVNASGLPDTQQKSTARDLASLAGALLDTHGDYYTYFSETRFSWAGRIYKNHNELLGKVYGVDGIKTGYTRASGFNLIASAKRDGRRVIAVMLGGNTAKSRNEHVEALLEAAFSTMGVAETGLPGLRSSLSFASIASPKNLNDAAEPMLNGKPLSAIIAEGGESSIVDDYIDGTEEGGMESFEDYGGARAAEAAAVPVANVQTGVVPVAAKAVADYEAGQFAR